MLTIVVTAEPKADGIAHACNAVGDSLSVEHDGSVFLRLVINQYESKTHNHLGQHGRHTDFHQPVYDAPVEPEPFQGKLHGRFHQEKFIEHPDADRHIG